MHKQVDEHTSTAPVLMIRGLSKSFGSKTAVRSMDLAIAPGEIFGFLGPNGAGKTTVIKLILDLLRPTSGSVDLFGISNRRTLETHRRIGYLSGDMLLDEDLTGRQYLSFAAAMHGGDFKARIAELATKLQVDLDVTIGNYSRGNKQKIGLIAALMHQPDFLILDEPSSGFDPLMQEVFMQLVQDYRAAGGTVFMSSHTLSEVQRLCDRVSFIREGEIVGTTTIAELNQSAAKQVTVSLPKNQAAGLKQRAAGLPGLKLTATKPGVLTFSYRGNMQLLMRILADFRLDDLTITEPDLEAVFMSYYQPGSVAKKQKVQQ